MTEPNAREYLSLVEDWLAWQDEDLSFRLRSPEDAIKLYRYSLKHSDKLPEFADDWTATQFQLAIGYNPYV